MGVRGVGADDEHGVVASDGADHLGPAFFVDAGGDGRGSAADGMQYEQILRLLDGETEALEQLGGRGQCIVADGGAGRGQRVAGRAFDQFELADVARERGLGRVKAMLGELAPQLVLVGDGGAGEQGADGGVAISFDGDTSGRAVCEVELQPLQAKDELRRLRTKRCIKMQL